MKQLLTIPLALLFIAPVFSQTKKEQKQKLKQQKAFVKEQPFVYIPTGSVVHGSSDQDVPWQGQTRSRVVSIDSFYMQEGEVTNFEYLEFVRSIKKTDTTLAKTLLPDTLVWRSSTMQNEPYVEYYLRHPAYNDYPVVGVSYNQVIAYAEWKTEQYNALPEEERIYKKVKFRLPTEEEWEYAARGGLNYSIYPWGGPYMQNSKGMHMANMLYVSQSSVYRDTVWVKNFRHAIDSTQPEFIPKLQYLSAGPSYYMGVAGNLNDNADITAPVISYWPNGYGLYNMAGNVEEMVDAYYNREDNLYEFSHSERKKSEDPSGVTRGGSWHDTGYYGMVTTRQFYEGRDYASGEMGFRLVMDVVEY
ncbi:MAG: hypothetical protein Crog4KO_07500 [Crocinitomicaceae bacterium]